MAYISVSFFLLLRKKLVYVIMFYIVVPVVRYTTNWKIMQDPSIHRLLASSKCKARFSRVPHLRGWTLLHMYSRKSPKIERAGEMRGERTTFAPVREFFEAGRKSVLLHMALKRGEPRAFEHQPRRQKICERELRIRVDCKALENILFGLRSAGARVLVVHVSHQLQALSISQHVLLAWVGCASVVGFYPDLF